ncbi:MAG: methyltransferase, partial [candidate division NC10 bacterium]
MLELGHEHRLSPAEEAKAIHSNGFEKIDKLFDVILLNPPQSAGKELCFKLIEDSKSHLSASGNLQLVA